MDRRAFLGGKPPRSASRGADFYTNAILTTQTGRKVRFYDDLVKDKLIAVNFIYTRCQEACPLSTSNLVEVQKLLGARFNHEVFMYSFTLKPWQDDAATLKAYARERGARWTFLTGSDYDLDTIRFRLFRWEHPALDFDLEQHTGMVTAINDPLDRWTMCPTLARPQQVVDAINWVAPTRPLAERQRDAYAKRDRLNAEQRSWIRSPEPAVAHE